MRQETVWPLLPINWRVAAPSIYMLTKPWKEVHLEQRMQLTGSGSRIDLGW